MTKNFLYILALSSVLMISNLFAGKTNISKSFSSYDLTNSVSTGKIFSYAPGHFKFVLPDYWQVIPDKALQSYKNILRKLYPGKPLQNYVLAIQRKALMDFAMPYALIEIEARPMPAVEEVEAEAINFAPNIRRAYIDLFKSNLFGEVKPMPAVYDPLNKVVVGYCSMFRAKDKQNLTTVTAIYPCRYGYVRFHFTFQQNTEEKYFPVIEEVIKSMKFDEGFAYDPSAAKKNSRGFNQMIYIIVIVLAIVWFGFRIFGRRINRGFRSGTK